MHLWRLKTHGSLDLPERVRPPRKTTCDADDCHKRRVGTSRYCSMHVKRLAVYGTLNPAFITAEDRFWRQVQRGGLGCWLWTGSLNTGGYGSVSFKGRSRKAHRVSYELLVGPIPAGLSIDHLCRVTACCNPRHFEVVTKGENARRSVLWRDTCPHGHLYDEANTYLSPKGVRNCRACKRIHTAAARAAKRAA